MSDDKWDALAELKKLMMNSGFYMKLTTAVVNHVNNKEQANDLLFKGMTDDEIATAVSVFRSLFLHTELRANQRNVKKPPAEWQNDKSIDRVVTQPYGWTHPGGQYEPQEWSVPVSRREFLDRMGMSSSMLKENGAVLFAYTEVVK